MIVAIDGPAGSGKSTVARAIARDCGFTYLDTGAMYRSVALTALEEGADLRNADELERIARNQQLSFGRDARGEQTVYLGERDVTLAIRTPAVDAAVSVVASVPAVRAVMVERQRSLAAGADAVAEGRDIGTVVFPHADVKVFLTASAEARAHRRADQNRARCCEQGAPCAASATDEAAVLAAIVERDRLDSSRAVSPLVAAEDAVLLDSSSLSVAEVVARVEELVFAARAAHEHNQHVCQ